MRPCPRSVRNRAESLTLLVGQSPRADLRARPVIPLATSSLGAPRRLVAGARAAYLSQRGRLSGSIQSQLRTRGSPGFGTRVRGLAAADGASACAGLAVVGVCTVAETGGRVCVCVIGTLVSTGRRSLSRLPIFDAIGGRDGLGRAAGALGPATGALGPATGALEPATGAQGPAPGVDVSGRGAGRCTTIGAAGARAGAGGVATAT